MEFVTYREHRQHGSQGFPLELYRLDQQHPRYIMTCHWHQECELILVHEGSLHIFLDSQEYLLNAGDICYIAQGVLHSAQPTDCVYDCIDFDPQALLGQTRTTRELLHHLENVSTVIASPSPVIRTCMEELLSAILTQEDAWQLIALSSLFRFYGEVLRNKLYPPAQTQADIHRLNHLKSALAHIQQNYQQHITLDELSRIAGLSPKYFCRYFRTLVHRSPMDYLNYFRIQHACTLLEQTRLSITQVADACGYNDSSYFSRCFKTYTGKSPLQYRKQSQK